MKRIFSATAMTALTLLASSVQAQALLPNTDDIYSAATFQVQYQTELMTASHGRVELPEDSTLTVIESHMMENGEELLRVGLDTEDFTTAPSDFWVKSSALSSSAFVLLAEIAAKMTYCFRYVKLYLMKKGLVKTYLPGSSAWMAKDILPKHGFRRSGRGPRNSRVNDVCVYSGGRGGHGHIEVLDSKGWYYGYGYGGPISQKGRPLISCFVK